MRRIASTLLVIFAAATLSAQSKIAITLPKPGPYRIWVATEFPPAPYAAHEVDSDRFSLEVAKPIGSEKVFVWDQASGNVASKLQRDIDGTYRPTTANFDHIGKVVVRIEHEGKPVSAATVTLDDGSKSTNYMVDPKSKGLVEAYNVRPGQLRATVGYRTSNGSTESLKQSFDLSLERSQSEPIFVVSIPYDVDTAPAETTQASAETHRANAPGGRNWISFVVAVAIAAVVGYSVFRWIQRNPSAVKQGLDSFGVATPEPDADPDDVNPLVPTPPGPQPQIILTDVAPTAVATPLAAGPRLVDASGDRLDLQEGVLVIGRDQTADLILAQESSVSRRHAEIEIVAGVATVRDLGSTNGTFLNGAKLSSDTLLRNGDEIRFGSAVFKFET